MKTRTILAALTATFAASTSTLALAQTTTTTTTRTEEVRNPTASNVGRIEVIGKEPAGGNMVLEDSPKQRSTVTKEAIDRQPASSNVFQLMSRLPGVNAQSTDATGLFGGALSIRGSNSDEIGFTVAGVPVNDSGNYAIFPQEYVDPENIREISVTQGAPDPDQPQGGASGGAVSINAEDPTDKTRVKIVQSVGELNFFKSFGRLDSGLIAGLPMKFFVSYSHGQTDKFAGPGQASRDHVDFVGTYEATNGSKFTVNSIYNRAINYSFSGPSLAQYRQFGRDFQFLESRFPGTLAPGAGAQNESTAIPVAQFPSDVLGATTYSRANYYKQRVNPFVNEIASFIADIRVSSQVTWNVTPYYWNGYGNGGGNATVAENGNNNFPLFAAGGKDLNGDGDKLDTLLYYRPSITSTQRPGVNSYVKYQPVDYDTIRLGVNFDHSRHHQTQPFERIASDGSPTSVWANDEGNLLTRGDGSFAQGRDQLTINDTTIFFLDNTFSAFNDTFKAILGIKHQSVVRDGENRLPDVVATGRQDLIHPSFTYDSWLPSIQLSYKPTPEHQVFANLQKNARAPSNFTLYEASARTNALNVVGSQQQQTAWNLDLGYRYQGPVVMGSVSAFGVNYNNKQVDIRLDPTDSTSLTNINAGKVHTRGVELEIGTSKPLWGFNFYQSASYTKSTIQQDLKPIVGNFFYPTKDKTYPNTPKWLLTTVIEYQNDALPGAFISVSPKYTSSRFSTLVNDEKMKGYTTVDLTAGYEVPGGIGPFSRAKVQINVVNLFDRSYLFGAYSNSSLSGLNALPIVNNGTTLAGSAPFYSVGAPRFFSAQFTAEF
jgi:iron complex outermembrane receptor protein